MLLLKLSFILTIIMFLSISIGYSAFNTTISISGEAVVRPDADIKISNLQYKNSTNSGQEGANSRYSKSVTSTSVFLPNNNSTITYTATITNKTGKYFTLKSLSTDIYSNANVKYTLVGLEINKVYQGSTYTFDITFTTTAANQSANLILSYEFEPITDTQWTYTTMNGYHTFTSSYDATYKIEAWGAQGGKVTAANYSASAAGGMGGYTAGDLYIPKGNNLYVYVGGKGTDGSPTSRASTLIAGGYNGGGDNGAYDALSAGAGGATDIRTTSGTWDNTTSLRSRIMVAGAGGSSGLSCVGAAGGINSGVMANLYGGNGTMTSGGAAGTGYSHDAKQGPGSFGKGGQGGWYGVGAGGSGYYGGGGGAHITPSTSGGGGGGSSYVSGCSTCNSVDQNGNHTGKKEHYSGYVFSNIIMTDGTKSMPTHNGTGTMTGNSGDGYAKITLLPCNN